MPYITESAKRRLSGRRNALGQNPKSAGDLNYLVTSLVSDYIGPQMSYDKINAAIGVLECAKLELYRRVAANYEDDKILQNGDVYPPEQTG